MNYCDKEGTHAVLSDRALCPSRRPRKASVVGEEIGKESHQERILE